MPTLHDTLAAMSTSLLLRQPDAEVLVSDGVFSAAQHLQVHRNNIFAGLIEALVAIYPVTAKLVGEQFFETACRHFIPVHPPQAAPLHGFGEAFATFLESYEPASSLPYLPDVARLEWAWHNAFHAGDAGAFNVSILTEIPVEEHGKLRFALHPAVRLVYSPYPVHRIFEVNQDHFTGDAAVDLDQGEAFVAVVRPHLVVRAQALPQAEWRFLQSLQQGQFLDDSLRQALAVDASFNLAEVLQRRVADRTLVSAYI